MEILYKLQKKSSTTCTHAKMRCHTEKLLKLAEIPPVNELYKSVALKLMVKIVPSIFVFYIDLHKLIYFDDQAFYYQLIFFL